MRYSVWNDIAQRYDYYEAPGTLRDGVFAPPAQLSGGHDLGIAADQAARALPTSASLVGHGQFAQGLIAARKGMALGSVSSVIEEPAFRTGLALVGGYALLKGLKVI